MIEEKYIDKLKEVLIQMEDEGQTSKAAALRWAIKELESKG